MWIHAIMCSPVCSYITTPSFTPACFLWFMTKAHTHTHLTCGYIRDFVTTGPLRWVMGSSEVRQWRPWDVGHVSRRVHHYRNTGWDMSLRQCFPHIGKTMTTPRSLNMNQKCFVCRFWHMPAKVAVSLISIIFKPFIVVDSVVFCCRNSWHCNQRECTVCFLTLLPTIVS